MKGSHGGHNGVRSVLDSLGTQEVRRVKLGVGRPATKHEVADHVLDPFERDELPVVEEAVAEAVEKVLSMV
jgi:PTH1 family peptidyl-tRNA hydrolase